MLLNKVLEELPENYRVFYINFRGFEGGYKKFSRALFGIGENPIWSKIKENLGLIAGAVEYVEKVAKKINNKIELPGEIVRILHLKDEDSEKVDLYKLFRGLNEVI